MASLKSFMRSLGVEARGIYFLTKKKCERATSKEMQSLRLNVDKGLCVFAKDGPTRAFLPAFRKFVSSTKEVDRGFLESLSKPLEVDWEDGFYILSYKKVPYFLVKVENGECKVI